MPLAYYFSIVYLISSYTIHGASGSRHDHAYDRALGMEYLFCLRTVTRPTPRFTVRDGQTGLLLLAMALTFAVSLLSVALPALKSSITGRLFHQKEERNLLLSDSDQDE